MSNAENVKQEAIGAKKILENLFKKFPDIEREFKASFHLRPTSSGNITIVSTLPFLPMRGLQNIKSDNLETELMKIIEVLHISDDKEKHVKLKKIGFKDKTKRTEAPHEDEAQAAFIRDLILRPVEYDSLQFVASEFELFEYREEEKNKKRTKIQPDVFAYKNGILYDIELKKDAKMETVTQAEGYVSHIKENLDIYTKCLYEFPNCKIGKIKEVKGIALVPYSKPRVPFLEKLGKDSNVEVWYFDMAHVIYNFIRK